MHRVALHRKLVLEHYCQVPMTQRGQMEPPAINKQEKGANEWLELAPGRDDPDMAEESPSTRNPEAGGAEICVS